MCSRPLYDVVAVLARLGVGIVFMAHGWQKIEAGITATGRSFDDLGVPPPPRPPSTPRSSNCSAAPR